MARSLRRIALIVAVATALSKVAGLVRQQAIAAALDEVRGNRRKAAEMLGIGERTLYRKIAKYGLEA